MDQIRRILENQQEVKYLTYFVYEDSVGAVIMEMTTLTISKKIKYKSKEACLNKLVDILFEMKKLEHWAERRL